jgi:hypothetical protein
MHGARILLYAVLVTGIILAVVGLVLLIEDDDGDSATGPALLGVGIFVTIVAGVLCLVDSNQSQSPGTATGQQINDSRDMLRRQQAEQQAIAMQTQQRQAMYN